MSVLPQVDFITAKMHALRERLQSISTETIALSSARDRILAKDVRAFRDSPSIDVSAMDGYAVRLADVNATPLPIAAIAVAGAEPKTLTDGTAIQIFTGAAVPARAQCVVKREECDESPGQVLIRTPLSELRDGENIRRRGENASQGTVIATSGSVIHGPLMAGLATFVEGNSVDVYRRLRVGILNTGDELIELGQQVQLWQIRDSNGPLIDVMLGRHQWIESQRRRVKDDPKSTERAIAELLEQCDVVLITGGVSMGDTDYVPQSIKNTGGEIVFHRIPIRPGKPMLGAVGPRGQLILGLPGNPVSVSVTLRRYGMSLIRYMAGIKQPEYVPRIAFQCDDTKQLDLVWFRLAKMAEDGTAIATATQGSGDVASLSQSDGFVEIPPGELSTGLRYFYAW